jgi:hypothetical protein
MNSLQALLSDEFELKYGLLDSASAIRAALSLAPEVIAVRREIYAVALPLTSVRAFTNEIMRDFRTGVQFEHATTLCGIAVALEPFPGEFTTEFFADLSELDLAELRKPIAVARLCRGARSASLASTITEEVRFAMPTPPAPYLAVSAYQENSCYAPA